MDFKSRFIGPNAHQPHIPPSVILSAAKGKDLASQLPGSHALRWDGPVIFGEYLSNTIREAAPAIAHHLVSQPLKWVIGIKPVSSLSQKEEICDTIEISHENSAVRAQHL